MPRNLCTFRISPFLRAFRYYIKDITITLFHILSVSSFVLAFFFLTVSHVLFLKLSLKYSKELLNLKSNIQGPKVTPSMFVVRRDATRTCVAMDVYPYAFLKVLQSFVCEWSDSPISRFIPGRPNH